MHLCASIKDLWYRGEENIAKVLTTVPTYSSQHGFKHSFSWRIFTHNTKPWICISVNLSKKAQNFIHQASIIHIHSLSCWSNCKLPERTLCRGCAQYSGSQLVKWVDEHSLEKQKRTPDTFQKWKLDQEKGKGISSPCSVTLGHLWPHVRHFLLQASVSPLLKEEVDRVMLRSYSYTATTRECSLSGQAQCDSPKTFTSKETDWDWNQSNYKACAPITVPSWCPMPCDFMKECLF